MCAELSGVATNRDPSCTASAPSIMAARMDRPSCSPPAAITGMSHASATAGTKTHGRRFFPAVVTASLKALGHHRIHPGFLGLQGKLDAAHHMHHLDAMFLQMLRPRPRVARAGEHNGDAEFDDARHVLFHRGIKQGDVHGEGLPGCGGLDLLDLVPQHLGIHAPRAQNPQSPSPTDSAGQLPSTAPHHARLDDGQLHAQKGAHAVGVQEFMAHGKLLWTWLPRSSNHRRGRTRIVYKLKLTRTNAVGVPLRTAHTPPVPRVLVAYGLCNLFLYCPHTQSIIQTRRWRSDIARSRRSAENIPCGPAY